MLKAVKAVVGSSVCARLEGEGVLILVLEAGGTADKMNYLPRNIS